MLRATGSTGRRKGPASFNFFRDRTVDWQNRYCATVRVDSSDEAEVEGSETGFVVGGGGTGAARFEIVAEGGGGGGK